MALARVRAIAAQGKGQYPSSLIHLIKKAILPDNAGRKADVLRTRRADLMVADICGNVGRKGKVPLGIEQAIAGCATTKLRPKNNNDYGGRDDTINCKQNLDGKVIDENERADRML